MSDPGSRPMGEFELIRLLTSGFCYGKEVKTGVGDDCAVLDMGGAKDVLFKTDALIEGVHFTVDMGWYRVGRKAMGRCLSDIAAMGGEPKWALVTLELPTDYQLGGIEELYRGLKAMANDFGVAIVGGETTRDLHRYGINIAMIGTIESGKAILRSGAKVGDAVFVTGRLGGSLDGHHLDFVPRVREAVWLRENFNIHSMMDLSDGLAGDLAHIAEGSGVGFELLGRSIPISFAAKVRGKQGDAARPPLLAALTDGEDFELVFTVASSLAVTLLDAWRIQFPEVPLTCVGKATAQNGIRIRDDSGFRTLEARGYSHF